MILIDGIIQMVFTNGDSCIKLNYFMKEIQTMIVIAVIQPQTEKRYSATQGINNENNKTKHTKKIIITFTWQFVVVPCHKSLASCVPCVRHEVRCCNRFYMCICVHSRYNV